MKWTENNIKNLENKVVLITGANSGIGFEKARLFAKHGSKVIMGVRSISRGNTAREEILKEFKDSVIDVLEIDLNDFNSIDAFSEELHKKYDYLDIVVNNAGIMTTPYQPTVQGFESQIGVNHMGHFYFTSKVLDLVKKSTDGRIIVTSSIAHKFGKIDVDTFKYGEGKKYSKSKAYAQSKLANMLFGKKLDRLMKENKTPVTVTITHPGVSSTNLGRYIKKNFLARFVLWLGGIIRQDAYMGSLPCMMAACEDYSGGEYIGPRGFLNFKGYPSINKVSKRAKDRNLQDMLWDESVIYTKAVYVFK